MRNVLRKEEKSLFLTLNGSPSCGLWMLLHLCHHRALRHVSRSLQRFIFMKSLQRNLQRKQVKFFVPLRHNISFVLAYCRDLFRGAILRYWLKPMWMKRCVQCEGAHTKLDSRMTQADPIQTKSGPITHQSERHCSTSTAHFWSNIDIDMPFGAVFFE